MEVETLDVYTNAYASKLVDAQLLEKSTGSLSRQALHILQLWQCLETICQQCWDRRQPLSRKTLAYSCVQYQPISMQIEPFEPIDTLYDVATFEALQLISQKQKQSFISKEQRIDNEPQQQRWKDLYSTALQQDIAYTSLCQSHFSQYLLFKQAFHCLQQLEKQPKPSALGKIKSIHVYGCDALKKIDMTLLECLSLWGIDVQLHIPLFLGAQPIDEASSMLLSLIEKRSESALEIVLEDHRVGYNGVQSKEDNKQPQKILRLASSFYQTAQQIFMQIKNTDKGRIAIIDSHGGVRRLLQAMLQQHGLAFRQSSALSDEDDPYRHWLLLYLKAANEPLQCIECLELWQAKCGIYCFTELEESIYGVVVQALQLHLNDMLYDVSWLFSAFRYQNPHVSSQQTIEQAQKALEKYLGDFYQPQQNNNKSLALTLQMWAIHFQRIFQNMQLPKNHFLWQWQEMLSTWGQYSTQILWRAKALRQLLMQHQSPDSWHTNANTASEVSVSELSVTIDFLLAYECSDVAYTAIVFADLQLPMDDPFNDSNPFLQQQYFAKPAYQRHELQALPMEHRQILEDHWLWDIELPRLRQQPTAIVLQLLQETQKNKSDLYLAITYHRQHMHGLEITPEHLLHNHPLWLVLQHFTILSNPQQEQVSITASADKQIPQERFLALRQQHANNLWKQPQALSSPVCQHIKQQLLSQPQSTSFLDSLSQCPFQAYGRYCLNLKAIQPASLSLKNHLAGLWAHRLLQTIYQQRQHLEKVSSCKEICKKQLYLFAQEQIEKLSAQDMQIHPLFLTASHQQLLWIVQKQLQEDEEKHQQILALGYRFADDLHADGPALELSNDTLQSSLFLQGTIDRIDGIFEKEGQLQTLAILDYKRSLPHQDKSNPYFQMRCHAAVAIRDFQQTAQSFRSVWRSLLLAEEKYLEENSRIDAQNTQLQLAKEVWQRLTPFLAGDIRPQPANLQKCESCELSALCRYPNT